MRKSLSIPLSTWSVLLCILMAVMWRVNYHSNGAKNGYNATTWDALGYYIYLPSVFIYNDATELNWFPAMDSTYSLSGDEFYQASQQEDSTYVFKYLGGTAIMQLPFFILGHAVASMTDYPADGFSAPYQYSIIWGAIFWYALGLWFLTKVLRQYYSEATTAITLLLLVGASNLLQYVSVDGAMSHAFIFPLYSLLLWWTHRWHQQPNKRTAFLIGAVIGLATISRPTEAIMIFIPILWSLNRKKSKWQFIQREKQHLLFAILGGVIGIMPQLIYWKVASGDWVYNVGSKWFFLNPWWRVLIGFEKGWFIYTPVAVFMMAGLFFLKGKPFRKAVIAFTLLNIWIIISWSDWTYGASYSTRALTHSYPVFALALAAGVHRFFANRWKYFSANLGLYLITLNQFQIWQYNAGIIHYNDMNESYYKAIYWDPYPTPLDYSLLDHGDLIPSKPHSLEGIQKDTTVEECSLENWGSIILFEDTKIDFDWVDHRAKLFTNSGIHQGQFMFTAFTKDTVLESQIFRLSLPFVENGQENVYHHQYKVPEGCEKLEIKLQSFGNLNVQHLSSKLILLPEEADQ